MNCLVEKGFCNCALGVVVFDSTISVVACRDIRCQFLEITQISLKLFEEAGGLDVGSLLSGINHVRKINNAEKKIYLSLAAFENLR